MVGSGSSANRVSLELPNGFDASIVGERVEGVANRLCDNNDERSSTILLRGPLALDERVCELCEFVMSAGWRKGTVGRRRRRRAVVVEMMPAGIDSAVAAVAALIVMLKRRETVEEDAQVALVVAAESVALGSAAAAGELKVASALGVEVEVELVVLSSSAVVVSIVRGSSGVSKGARPRSVVLAAGHLHGRSSLGLVVSVLASVVADSSPRLARVVLVGVIAANLPFVVLDVRRSCSHLPCSGSPSVTIGRAGRSRSPSVALSSSPSVVILADCRSTSPAVVLVRGRQSWWCCCWTGVAGGRRLVTELAQRMGLAGEHRFDELPFVVSWYKLWEDFPSKTRKLRPPTSTRRAGRPSEALQFLIQRGVTDLRHACRKSVTENKQRREDASGHMTAWSHAHVELRMFENRLSGLSFILVSFLPTNYNISQAALGAECPSASYEGCGQENVRTSLVSTGAIPQTIQALFGTVWSHERGGMEWSAYWAVWCLGHVAAARIEGERWVRMMGRGIWETMSAIEVSDETTTTEVIQLEVAGPLPVPISIGTHTCDPGSSLVPVLYCTIIYIDSKLLAKCALRQGKGTPGQ
ncbi:hypothetical protein BDZ97DRAFT_1765882 [Flammula alnicola]|nr:hypothetical protein BDZ97DRAFT_1765882 [Flammula alnicola]